MTRAIAVLGTASDVGKSLIATAICKLFADAGFGPAPFKAQNMSLQAGVTPDGGEMSRAQILQAQACGLRPHVDMNPVLLKPVTEREAEVIALGRVLGRRSAASYFQPGNTLAEVADAALDRLAARYRLLVIEGAGSPVELNLMDRDFVNLRPVRRVDAAIVLVADIDRGGVFAQVKGTLDLLPSADRQRVLGVVVNKFRGDPELFEDGVARLEDLAGVPVLAVVPWANHGLDEEDRPLSLPIDAPPVDGRLNVAVVLHPHVANTDDLAPLLSEPDVAMAWVTNGRALGQRDLVILPGTKATVADLQHHTANGLAEAIRQTDAWVLGLCGGYQMLGRTLIDPLGTDGPGGSWPGLGLLDVETIFAADKQLGTPRFQSAWPSAGHAIDGYEIHHGRTAGMTAPLVEGAGAEVGAVAERAVGCYLHGLLRSDGWRNAFLNRIRREPRPVVVADDLEARISRWARHVRASFRPGGWERLANTL